MWSHTPVISWWMYLEVVTNLISHFGWYHMLWDRIYSLQWYHNECNGVSNHWPSPLFAQLLVQAQFKENIKALSHWALCGEFVGDRWIPHTKGLWCGKCFHFITSSYVQIMDKQRKLEKVMLRYEISCEPTYELTKLWTWLRWWFVARRHHLITWTYVDLS